MSAIGPRIETESEDDADYIPSADADSSSDEEPEPKRARTNSPNLLEHEKAEKKQVRDALWSDFQASLAAPVLPRSGSPRKMIKIEKRYRFAGEDVVEVVEVTEDSPEAKKWPVWRDLERTDMTPKTTSGSETIAFSASLASESVCATKAPEIRPGPRKGRTTLVALPAPSTREAKKLSTLDKSAMDWRAHVQSQQNLGLKDELEANRRSGGYLESVEFLKRVEERKESVIEASKAGKRRRL